MKTLTVTLKQHTPLIHFQHDQYGATLRASEVKPKLDKYIIKEFFGNNYEECKRFLVGYKCSLKNTEEEKIIEENRINNGLRRKFEEKGFRALNYKMSINIDNECLKIWDINEPQKDFRTGEVIRKNGLVKLKTYPNFFANMDKDYENPKEYKRFSIVQNGYVYLNLTFNGNNNLYDAIKERGKEIFSGFFFSYNFGMRSSKGFGSFYPALESEFYMNYTSKYKITSRTSKITEKSINQLFLKIELFYKTIRSGINLKNKAGETIFYFKSLLRDYFQKQYRHDWEKRQIQNSLSKLHDDANCYALKDLMGFSKEEEWKAFWGAKIKKSIAISDHGTWRRPTNDEEKKLPQRMQSPLFFKPIYDEKQKKFIIYIRFLSQRVGLSSFLQYEKLCISSDKMHDDLIIDFPDSFKLSDLFNYIVNVEISDYVDEDYQGHEYYDNIRSSYDDLFNLMGQ